MAESDDEEEVTEIKINSDTKRGAENYVKLGKVDKEIKVIDCWVVNSG